MNKVLWLVFSGILLAGCMPVTLPVSTFSPTLTALPPTSTATPLPPTVAPTETVTPTSTSDAHLTVKCLDILPELPADTSIEGNIALEQIDRPAFESFLLNINSGEKFQLRGGKNQYLKGSAVSPDQKWLAYLLWTQQPWTSRLVVMGPTGTLILDRLVSDREWFNLAGWVNNTNLVFSRFKWNDNGDYLFNPLDAVLYNPFTREQREFPSQFPKIWNLEFPIWGAYRYIEAMYDSTLSYAIYPQIDSNLVLWDLKQKQPVITFATNAFYGNTPFWSPDGQKFLTHNSLKEPTSNSSSPYTSRWDELFSIDTSGKVTQLTNLTAYYPTVEITDYSWSPNGRYIAFWVAVRPDTYPGLSNGQTSAFRLAVLDSQTGQVTNFCIRGGASYTEKGGRITSYPPNVPIWSPDSTSLLTLSPNESSKTMVVLVNVQQGYAAKVADDMIPKGWLANTP